MQFLNTGSMECYECCFPTLYLWKLWQLLQINLTKYVEKLKREKEEE